jgi:hypothetical protein
VTSSSSSFTFFVLSAEEKRGLRLAAREDKASSLQGLSWVRRRAGGGSFIGQRQRTTKETLAYECVSHDLAHWRARARA